MNLVDELHAVAAALTAAGIDYAICGGIAVTAHGATRSTKDIDILIRPSDVTAALDAVRPLGYSFAAVPMTFDEGTERERHVQRVTKVSGNDHLVLDLLLEQAAFHDTLADRMVVELPEGSVTIVSRETLIRMKRLAGRDQDRADIAKLEAPDEA
jgi:hypothetical protein